MEQEISEKLISLNDRLELVTVDLEKINSREVLFDFPPTEYPEIESINTTFQPYGQV
jgi:hypothetical protein